MIRDLFLLLKATLKYAGNTVIVLLFLLLLYGLFAIFFTLIPSNMFSKQPKEGITIYIKSNGVHTDLVLPMENKFYDWNEKIFLEDFNQDTTDYQWMTFGWGDKGFYLDTPNWSDLKVSTAINAMLLPTPTAMHVCLYGNTIKENERTKRIILTEEQYLILCGYIFNSFQKDDEESFILINGCHYRGVNDNFYEAEGSYYLFNTCNNWANSALKTAGVRTAFWARLINVFFIIFEKKTTQITLFLRE